MCQRHFLELFQQYSHVFLQKCFSNFFSVFFKNGFESVRNCLSENIQEFQQYFSTGVPQGILSTISPDFLRESPPEILQRTFPGILLKFSNNTSNLEVPSTFFTFLPKNFFRIFFCNISPKTLLKTLHKIK